MVLMMSLNYVLTHVSPARKSRLGESIRTGYVLTPYRRVFYIAAANGTLFSGCFYMKIIYVIGTAH